MKFSRHHLFTGTAVVAACGAIAATAAQAGGPPPDPGWIGLPHCQVPDVEGVQLVTARRTLHRERCGIMAPMRRRSTARRNSVLIEVPEAGTHLAPGTKVLLVVSNGRRR